jgi:uncharacterized membrane protein
MGVNSFLYNLFLLLHIVCVIVGFGGVVLNGVYAARAQKLPPAQGLAVMETNTFVSVKVAELFIYAVPVFGLGLVGLSDKVYSFSQLWVWLSLLVYVVALGVSHGALMPRVKRMLRLQHEMLDAAPAGGAPAGGPPPQVAEVQGLGQQIGMISMVLHLSLVVLLVLMIWKPGF